MVLIICIVSIVVVLGVVAIELVGWLVERKARARFEKMTPEERYITLINRAAKNS